MIKRTIRVYGFLLRQGRVIVAIERIQGVPMVKFPGGGVKVHEGLSEALIREFQEELGIQVQVGEHIYVNDFAVTSMFNSEYNVLSHFFMVHSEGEPQGVFVDELEPPNHNGEHFSWQAIDAISPESFTSPIEQAAMRALKARAKTL